jgi:hypothetical protein
LGVPLEVLNGSLQTFDALVEKADTGITTVAKNAANSPGIVVMIDMPPTVGIAATDGAPIVLLRKHGVELFWR